MRLANTISETPPITKKGVVYDPILYSSPAKSGPAATPKLNEEVRTDSINPDFVGEISPARAKEAGKNNATEVPSRKRTIDI